MDTCMGWQEGETRSPGRERSGGGYGEMVQVSDLTRSIQKATEIVQTKRSIATMRRNIHYT